MTPKPVEKTYFQAKPVLTAFGSNQIDAENGILRDVVMVVEGAASGHFVHLESEFISQLVEYDNRNFSKTGLKAYFGHRFGSDAMGAQLGVFRNFRKRKNGDGKMEAYADLHLLQASKNSPRFGNVYEWVFQMASEAPNMIMSSIVFDGSRYYQRKANGHKTYVFEYDSEGNWQSYKEDRGNVYVEFGENTVHHRTDLVDDGAATTNLFDSHPEPGIPPQNPKKFYKMNLRELFFGKEKPESEVALSPEEVTELRQKMAAAETALAKSSTEKTALEKQISDLSAERDDFKTKFEALSAEHEKLKEHPAAPKTAGAKETEQPEPENAWSNTDINRRAQQQFAQKTKKLPW